MATATLGVKVTNNYSEHIQRLLGAPGRLTRAIQGATVDNRRVMSQQVERDLVDIAGGKYWDVISSTTPTTNGATARVYTPKSKEHRIEPKSGKALAFEWAGAPPNLPRLKDGRVVLRGVNHPGSRPPDWIIRFRASAPELIKRNYSTAIERTLSRL